MHNAQFLPRVPFSFSKHSVDPPRTTGNPTLGVWREGTNTTLRERNSMDFHCEAQTEGSFPDTACPGASPLRPPCGQLVQHRHLARLLGVELPAAVHGVACPRRVEEPLFDCVVQLRRDAPGVWDVTRRLPICTLSVKYCVLSGLRQASFVIFNQQAQPSGPSEEPYLGLVLERPRQIFIENGRLRTH